MKKLSVLLLLLSFVGFSQEFELTKTGLVDKFNNENYYLVIEAPKKDSLQLFNNAIRFINENFKNPTEVIKSKTEGEYLKYEGFSPRFLKVSNGGIKIDIDCHYTIELRFKNGKVKFDIIDLVMDASDGGSQIIWQGSSWSGFTIWNKKGKLKREQTKVEIESYFNTHVNSLSTYLNGKKTEKDKW